MIKGETELGMVQRHVLQGASLIARQQDILKDLRINERSTEMAEILLWNFEDVQRQHKEHLLRLDAKD